MATKNQPVKEVPLGRTKAVIWKNPGSNGRHHNHRAYAISFLQIRLWPNSCR